MILSVSRRTDIPAFYSEWFFKRLEKGFLYVKNPMNRKQISEISLDQEVIDCIVFWTKNPGPMISQLHKIKDYNFYFQYTITPYDLSIEKMVPTVDHSISTFKSLSDRIGSKNIIWRYDPIFLTDKYNFDRHVEEFSKLAKSLSGYTKKCVISFLDVYKKCERNMRHIRFETMTNTQTNLLAKKMSEICSIYGIEIETCAEDIDLLDFGIKKGKCIDDDLIAEICKKNIKVKKDKNQREVCGCVSSIDIGDYNSCPHSCLYCYANFDSLRVEENLKQHDSNCELLYGRLIGDEKITLRKMTSLFEKAPPESSQGSLF
ncbi:MAG: hypothetical protein C0618_00835 [Desulfuromonas sp.]|nr:MAG: hypothetical protein C0618_00835 [Desulfuromonas sp.]